MPMADSSLIYPHCYFEQVALPIKGEYNDYGTLENIEKDANTEIIENYFQVSIEAFVEGITSFRQYKDKVDPKKGATRFEQLLPRLTGMFIYRPIFDSLKEAGDDDWLFHSRESQYGQLFDDHVKGQLELAGTKAEIDALKARIAEDMDAGALKEELKLMLEDTSIRRIMFAHGNRFTENHRNWFRFNEIYGPHLINDTLKDDFCAWIRFYHNMYSANKFFFPAMNGEQHGNLDASLLLARETVRLLEEKKKKYMENCGEEYE